MLRTRWISFNAWSKRNRPACFAMGWVFGYLLHCLVHYLIYHRVEIHPGFVAGGLAVAGFMFLFRKEAPEEVR